MPTFVEEVQSVAAGDAPEFRRRMSTRIETVGDAVGVLEAWTEESRETRTELVSKYETAKTLARDEIRDAGGGDERDADEEGETDETGETDENADEDGNADEGGDEEGTADEGPEAIPPAELLAHPEVTDRTKRRLREYSTKLHAFLDEEQSYEGAREQLRAALGDELTLYQRLLADLETDATSVRAAQGAVARFAREETPGSANATATDVLLDAEVGGE